MKKKTLKELRREIDRLDIKILSLLNKRAGFALQIGKVKARKDELVYAPDREQQVYRKLTCNNKGPLSNDAVRAIYKEVISGALAVEKKLRIAYFGPSATFTHLAALEKFGSQAEYISCNTIAEVFGEVEKARCDYGVVPIENSMEGAVTYTLDMFMESELKICSEVVLKISHNLLAKCKRSQIKKVYSNPQAFAQCRIWLESHLTGVERVEVSSTAKAAGLAAKEKDTAAVAGALAAKRYGLKVLARSIEDSLRNVTRFLIVGREMAKPTGRDKTSIMFSVKDKPGALHSILLPFRKCGINMTKIESRPSKRKVWEYCFFVDVEGHWQDAKVKKALREMERECPYLKVLGSYPIVGET